MLRAITLWQILLPMRTHEVIFTGLHLELTSAMKSIFQEKLEKLFRHEEEIIRIRVEVSHLSNRSQDAAFVAKGHIEINGPDLVVSAATDDLYKSVDLLVDKLDRKLRRRHRLELTRRRDGLKMAAGFVN